MSSCWPTNSSPLPLGAPASDVAWLMATVPGEPHGTATVEVTGSVDVGPDPGSVVTVPPYSNVPTAVTGRLRPLRGVTVLDSADRASHPAWLIAWTVNVAGCSLARPVTVVRVVVAGTTASAAPLAPRTT